MHLDKTTKSLLKCERGGSPPVTSGGADAAPSRRSRLRSAWNAPSVLAVAAAATLILLGAGPRLAKANDLSTDPCTAGDVEVVGSGLVVNEPCSCPPGTLFNAQVQFKVRNNTSSGRYCVTLHLVPDGVLLTSPLDVILRDASGSSTAAGKTGSEKYHDTIMYGSIPNFSCSTGLVCFGQAGSVTGKCAPNTCTTIAWNTSSGVAGCTTADQNPPGGQCRHQQVCVIGFGALLSCIANCGVTCGGTATLQACVNSPTNRGPFTLALTGNDGSSQSQSTFGDPSGTTCLNFSVSPTRNPTTTYTLTVTDKDGCTRTATTSLDVKSNPTANGGLDQSKCAAGATTAFTLAGSANNGTPAWSVVSGPVTIADSSNLSSGATFTGTGTATLRLTVSNPPCPAATDDVVLSVNSNPTANAGLDQVKCAAGATTAFTLAGSASNGTPTWSVVSGPVTIADPSNLNSGVTFTGSGTATLRLTVASTAKPACASATDDVVIVVNANPTAGAGLDQSKCAAGATTAFTLAGSASNGTPTWSVVSGPVTIADPNNLNSGVTFTGGGTATLRLTVTSNAKPSCPAATDDVALNVTQTTVTITPLTKPACNGVLQYGASVDGHTDCGFTWSIDGQSLATFAAGGAADDARVARVSGTGNGTLEFRALDSACHTITVTTSCPAVGGVPCTATASATASQCVGSTLGCH